jgi:TolB protein
MHLPPAFDRRTVAPGPTARSRKTPPANPHGRQTALARFGGFACAAALLAISLLAAAPVRAGALLGDEPIVVRPSEREPERIAIPAFEVGRSPVQLQANDFHSIIYSDLEITGYFLGDIDQTFIEQTRARDRKTDKIDFAEWNRLKAQYLLVGRYEIKSDELEASCILYYVPSGKRIFGRRFRDKIDNKRVLAHSISDEIFRWVTGENGIANTKILYVSTSDPTLRKRDVLVMDADGVGARRVTNDGSLVATPCWGANGTEIYYTSWKDYNPDLYGIYFNGAQSWTISRFKKLNLSPSWSQANERVALTLSKDGNSEIYTMDRTGGQMKRLTYNPAIDSSPQWSPDGKDIVFTSNRSGSPQIYVMDADGLNPQRISWVGSNYCDSAAWSPKGDKIAFTARLDGVFDIWVVSVDGTERQRLTYNAGNNEDPTWAPNGLMLAFVSERLGPPQIYVMNADGSNQRRLTRTGHNTAPAWSPYLYRKPK